MKRILLIISVVLMVLSCGCSKKNDLSACDEKRKEIEEKYGITICYGDDKVEAKELKDAKMLSDETRINTSLDEIDTFFSKLPVGFLEEMEKYSNKKICIIILDEDLTGVALKNVEKQQWAVDCTMITSSLAIDMINSIYWYTKNADVDLKFLKDWDKYNPSAFEYGNPDKYKKYLYGNANDYECYFMLENEMLSMIDDVELSFMGLWMESSISLQDETVVPKIRAKLQYLCSELDRVFETVDENAYWARYIK